MTDKEETDMTAIAQRITSTPATDAAAMALRIKNEAPTLAALTAAQLEQIARLVMTQRLTAELSTAVDLAGIDYQAERTTWLADAKSAQTRRAYAAALARLDTWTAREKKNPLTLTAIDADAFIRALKAEGRAAASVRRDIAAISAFYSWLERYHATIKNPIRGTRLRPAPKAAKVTAIPDKAELKTILAALPPTEKAVVLCLAGRGLRIGALPTLERKGTRYTGQSKGKELEEAGAAGVTLPADALAAIADAGLDTRAPFAQWTADALQRRINYHMGKLHQAGKIKAAYSCHDFRHYYAVREYTRDRDIYRLSKLLNHAGIQITQTYLKTIGIEI